MVILQSGSFQSRGHTSQRVISLAPGGVRSQRSQTRLQGEGLNHQSVALLVISVHIDNVSTNLIFMVRVSTKENQASVIFENLHCVTFGAATL